MGLDLSKQNFMDEQITLFRAKRGITVLAKYFLGMLDDLRAEHDKRIEQTGESLAEMEEFLYEKHSVDTDLAHLTKHFEFFDETKFQSCRKKILDTSNNIQRELNQL